MANYIYQYENWTDFKWQNDVVISMANLPPQNGQK